MRSTGLLQANGCEQAPIALVGLRSDVRCKRVLLDSLGASSEEVIALVETMLPIHSADASAC